MSAASLPTTKGVDADGDTGDRSAEAQHPSVGYARKHLVDLSAATAVQNAESAVFIA